MPRVLSISLNMDLSSKGPPQLHLTGRVKCSSGMDRGLEGMFPTATSWVKGLLEEPLVPLTACCRGNA